MADFGYGIAVSDSGYVYTTGSFQRTVNFSDTANPYELKSNGSNADCYVTKHKTDDGELIWVRRIGGTFTEAGRGLSIDKRDNVYLVGNFNRNDFSLNPDSLVGPVKTKGSNDIFIVKLNSEGGYKWGGL